MRKLLAPLVVLGLLVGGIGAAGASVHADDSGVTKDQIKVGVTYVDVAALRSAGIKIDHGDYETSFRTVIDDINAKGGVNGRKIVPIFAPVNPVGTDPSQKACLELTEDQKVFAVVGFFLNDGPLCYVEQHKTPVLGGTMTSEYLARAKAPWYTLEPGDPDIGLVVDAFANERLLTKGKLGIVTHSQEKSLLDGVVLPALKKQKISGSSAIIDAPPSDTAAAEAQASTIVERFKTDGVKTILLVGNSVAAISRALAKTSYRPRLIGTSASVMTSYARDPSSDLSVIQNAVSASIGRDFNDPALQSCYQMVSKATGESIVEYPAKDQPSNVTSADQACRYMTLFTALATAAGKNLTTASFAKAGQKAGSVQLPGSGSITYDPKTHEFNQPVYLYRYDPATKQIVKDPEPVGGNAASSR